MANIVKTYTFVNSQPADGTQVNKNFDDIIAGVGDTTTLHPTITAAAATVLDDITVGAMLTTLGAPMFNCGSYTGNAEHNRAITIGFQPKVVWVYIPNTGPSGVRIDATDGRAMFSEGSGPPWYAVAGLVLSATGFVTADDDTVYFSCNRDTTVYRWEAWG
jgi:hypothetical protein